MEENPNHGFAVYNLAVLLEEKSAKAKMNQEETKGEEEDEEMERIEELFINATRILPTDPTVLADAGRFLISSRRDEIGGRDLLIKALQIDRSSEVALFNLSIWNITKGGSENEAKGMLEKLVKLNPRHVPALGHLARLDAKLGRSAKSVIKRYRAAIDLSNQDDKLKLTEEAFKFTLSKLGDKEIEQDIRNRMNKILQKQNGERVEEMKSELSNT